MAKDPEEWKGCFIAVVTPFKENGNLDTDALPWTKDSGAGSVEAFLLFLNMP